MSYRESGGPAEPDFDLVALMPVVPMSDARCLMPLLPLVLELERVKTRLPFFVFSSCWRGELFGLVSSPTAPGRLLTFAVFLLMVLVPRAYGTP